MDFKEFFKRFLLGAGILLVLSLIFAGIFVGCRDDSLSSWSLGGRDLTFRMDSQKLYHIESEQPVQLEAHRRDNGFYIVVVGDAKYGSQKKFFNDYFKTMEIKSGDYTSTEDVEVELHSEGIIAVTAKNTEPIESQYFSLMFTIWFASIAFLIIILSRQ